MTPGTHMSSTTNAIPKGNQGPTNHIPGLSAVVAFEVADILKENVVGLPVFQDLRHLVKECPPSRILKPPLIPGFRKRLTGKASAENVVNRDRSFAEADVSEGFSLHPGEVVNVEFA